MLSPMLTIGIFIAVLIALVSFLAYKTTHMKIQCYNCHQKVPMEDTALVNVKSSESGPGGDGDDNIQYVCLVCADKRSPLK